jgi:hypothetical protein
MGRRTPICTHKKHPGTIKPNKYSRKCCKHGGCPYLTFEETKDSFIDNHKRL